MTEWGPSATPVVIAPERGKGLRAGALGFAQSLTIGVASAAPAYSLAATLGLITADVGFQSPAVMWIAFLPMLLAASAYYSLNKTDPDCGTTFAWATRAFGPRAGWIGGWAILLTGLLVMVSLADVVGSYSLLLVGADKASFAPWVAPLLGTLSIVLMCVLAYRGIELAAHLQTALLGVELLALAIFSIVAVAGARSLPPGDPLAPSWSWLNPLPAPSARAVTTARVGGVFIYGGGDSAVSVNEETRAPRRTPGLSAIVSTFVLVVTYVGVSVAGQAVGGAAFLTKNSKDVMGALAKEVLSPPLDTIVVVAVLTSALASMLTTILPTARTALAMALRGALPAHFARVHRDFASPTAATVWTGGLSLALYFVIARLAETALTDTVEATGLVIAFYYGLTCLACVWLNRRQVFRSVGLLVLAGVAPLIGACAFAATLVCVIDFGKNPTYLAIGGCVVGVLLMAVQARSSPAFFRFGSEKTTGQEPG
jgi:amino acid transporter